METEHWAIYVTNASPITACVESLLKQRPPKVLASFRGRKGYHFSQLAVDTFIEEEVRHDLHLLNPEAGQALRTFSSGERKKALFKYILKQNPQFLILDNPFDNLDEDARKELRAQLEALQNQLSIIQIISRHSDLLPFINRYAKLNRDGLTALSAPPLPETDNRFRAGTIPEPIERYSYTQPYLVRMKNVTISYGAKTVVRNVNWTVEPGAFWQLAGPNGSGKTTLLTLITGDNPKAYGQDIYLFGSRKGSGESVWDIKSHIGYFTPAMTDRFRGHHTLEHMLISGLLDSIGLYVTPTQRQKQLAMEWLTLLNMAEKSQKVFATLTPGEKRLIMCARAMIKHPLLLILDEPTAGLDDESAALIVDLVNKMAADSKTAIIFVSHRMEEALEPDHGLQLIPDTTGSKSQILSFP